MNFLIEDLNNIMFENLLIEDLHNIMFENLKIHRTIASWYFGSCARGLTYQTQLALPLARYRNSVISDLQDFAQHDLHH